MKQLNKKGLLVLFLLCLVAAGILIAKPVFKFLFNTLSSTERIHANTLLIEGWLPPFALESAFKEYRENDYEHVITTGLKMPEYFILPMNGYLVFYLQNGLEGIEAGDRHFIEVNAFSEFGNEHSAHFNVFVNDSLITGFTIGRQNRKYGFIWGGGLTASDSIMVQYDNDAVGSFGDRNLYIKEIIIDHKIVIPYTGNSVYYIARLDGKRKIANDVASYAGLAKKRLLDMGMDSSKIIAVAGKRVSINRTLTSVLAVRSWLESSDFKIEGINIISEGTHARRTWMTYRDVLNRTDIGIISVPDRRSFYSRRFKFISVFREALKYVYYRLILIVY